MLRYEKRVCLLYCAVVLAVSLLLARLYNLSKPETNESLTVLEGQYTGKIEVCERGGFVYDRNGYLMSHNLTGHIALVNPEECTDALECAEALSSAAVSADLSGIFDKIISGVPFTVTLQKGKNNNMPKGITVFDAYEENTSLAKHFMGYNNSDGRGMSGLRLAYDEFLGESLYSTVTARFDTDAKRKSMSPFLIDTEKYLSDDGVVTTIDKPLQNFVDGFSDTIESGAVVVADTETGEILAMSSFPGYNIENMAQYLDSDKGELINRASMSFVPGSVFKIVVAATALEENLSLYDLEYICEGKIQVEDATFKCHKHSGHGNIDMATAFAESCNTYFINLGMLLGLEKIADTAKKLGLDERTYADFAGEGTNHFLSTDDKTSGYIANISFGQGDLCLSPLDMTRIVTAAACGHLVQLSTIRGEIREGVFLASEREQKVRVFSRETCEKIRKMMEKCVNDGTGTAAAVMGISLGGKTATAQTGRFSKEGVEYVHKWFCGVYPVEKPRVSVCVLFDDVTEQKASPAVVFSEICKYLKEKGF